MIYLYGLLQPSQGADPAGLEVSGGVNDGVAIAPCAGLSLIYRPHDGSEILPRRRALLKHAEVLENAMQSGTVLPMRFGMTCGSLAEFEGLVRASEPRVREALQRVKARVELGVRITASEPAALSAALSENPNLVATRDRLAQQGREAHFAKAEFGRALGEDVATRRQAAQKLILTELRAFAADHVLKAPESDFEVLRAEFLIDEAHIGAFSELVEDRVRALDFASPEPCVARLIGPGPPFHFVGLSLMPDTTEVVA